MLANLRVTVRLSLLILLSVLLMSLLVGFGLYNERTSIYNERKDQLRSVVSTTYGILESLNNQVVAGSLSLEEAQDTARQLIHPMRLGNNEYFFAITPQGITHIHGGNPSLVGMDLSNRTIEDGRRMFKIIGETVSLGRNASQFLEYDYPKPGETKSSPKISYVMGFDAWNWSLGAGIYIDNISDVIFSSFIKLAAVLLASLAILAAVAVPLAHSIIKPLQEIGQLMDTAAKGDIRGRLNFTNKCELGSLSRRIDIMLDSFTALLDLVGNSSSRLSGSAKELNSAAKLADKDINRQVNETEQLAAAMQQMLETVQEVAHAASETSNAIDEVEVDAAASHSNLNKTISQIETLAAEITSAATVIAQLEESTNEISRVLAEIEGISEQTNLLALNAAIEAARAGESGRGFAVVADEVRQLAQRTQASTEEINKMNQQLSQAAQRAVRVMQASRETAEESVTTANSAGESLEQIVNSMTTVRTMAVQVATSTEEQSKVAEEMSTNLDTIADLSGKTHQTVNEVTDNSRQLTKLAVKLTKQIARFKT